MGELISGYFYYSNLLWKNINKIRSLNKLIKRAIIVRFYMRINSLKLIYLINIKVVGVLKVNIKYHKLTSGTNSENNHNMFSMVYYLYYCCSWHD